MHPQQSTLGRPHLEPAPGGRQGAATSVGQWRGCTSRGGDMWGPMPPSIQVPEHRQSCWQQQRAPPLPPMLLMEGVQLRLALAMLDLPAASSKAQL